MGMSFRAILFSLFLRNRASVWKMKLLVVSSHGSTQVHAFNRTNTFRTPSVLLRHTFTAVCGRSTDSQTALFLRQIRTSASSRTPRMVAYSSPRENEYGFRYPTLSLRKRCWRIWPSRRIPQRRMYYDRLASTWRMWLRQVMLRHRHTFLFYFILFFSVFGWKAGINWRPVTWKEEFQESPSGYLCLIFSRVTGLFPTHHHSDGTWLRRQCWRKSEYQHNFVEQSGVRITKRILSLSVQPNSPIS